MSAKAVSKVPGKGPKAKKRSKAQALEDAPTPSTVGASEATKAKEKNWGIFEPIRGLLGPVADIVEGLFDSKVIAGVLFILLIWSLFFRSRSTSLSQPHTPAQRIAAYEQIWQTEEAELWKWMEERVALDRVHEATGRKIQQAREMQDKLVDHSMTDRQVDEAIRVTEERLEALKHAVKRGRDKEKVNETGK